MSDNTDKRVVQLEFDNSKFERNTRQSMSTLDKLNKKLDFSNVSDGLDKVTVKFSAFEVAAISVINNITNRITNLGIQLVKSLSVDQIYSGWAKYAQKSTSVATLMAQRIKVAGRAIEDTGEKLEVVNDLLDKLNWFADETSYSFTDMVDSIGKFSAAGIDLDKSVKAMMGIANWAALSGQNAATASRAMYQLAQAMGKGKVQLIDYKSIQNANMDTQEFRQTVLDTAVALGQLTKAGDKYTTKAGKTFNINQFAENLSDGWFTSKVLTESLSKYSAAVERIYEISNETGLTASEVIQRYGSELDAFGIKAFKAAQEARTFSDAINSVKDAVSSKWLTTAEKIFGNYQESTKLWTDLANELYDVFAEGGNFRNEILSQWREMGGRADLFAHNPNEPEKQGAFWNIYDAIIALKELVASAWNEIFPKSQFKTQDAQIKNIADRVKEFTEHIRELTAKIKASIKQLAAFKNILEVIFGLVKLGIITVKAFWYAIEPVVSWIARIIGNLFGLVGDSSKFIDVFEKIANAVANVATKIHDAAESFIEFSDFTNLAKLAVEGFYKVSSLFAKVFGKIKSAASSAAESIRNFFGSFSASSNESSGGSNNIVRAAVVVNAEKQTSVIDNIKNFIIALWIKIKNSDLVVVAIIRSIIEIYGSLKRALNSIIKIVVANIAEIIETIAQLITAIANSAMILLKSSLRLMITAVEMITALINTLISVIKGLFTAITVMASVVGKTIEKLIDKLDIEEVSDVLSDFIASFVYLAVDGLLPLITSVIRGFADFFKDFANNTVKILKGILSAMKYILIALVIVWSLGGNFIAAFFAIRSLLYALEEAINPVGYAIGRFGDKLELTAKAMNKQALATLIKEFANAILKIVIAVAILGNMPTDKLIKGTIALVVITALLLAFMFVVLKFGKVSESTGTVVNNTMLVFKDAVQSPFGKFKALFSDTVDQFKEFANAFKQAAVFNAIAYMIKSIGDTVLKIAIAFAIFDTVDEKGFIAGSVILGILLASVAALVVIAKKCNLDEKSLLNLATVIRSLNSVAKMLITMAISLNLIASIETGKLWSAVGVIAVLMTVILATIYALNKITNTLSDSGNSAKDVFKPLFAVVGALVILSLTLAFLSLLDQAKLWSAVGVITTISLVVAGLTAIYGVMKKAELTNGTVSMVASMIAFAGGMYIIALAMQTLSTIDWDTVGKAAAMIGIFLLTMVGGGALVAAFPALAAGIAVIVAAIIGFSAGIMIFALAIDVLANAVSKFSKLGAEVEAFGKNFATFLVAVVTSIIEVIPLIAKAIATGLVSIIKELTLVLPEIAILLFEMCLKFIAILTTYVPTIVMKLTELIGVVLISLMASIAKLVQALIPLYVKFLRIVFGILIKALGDFLEHLPEDIVKAIEYVGKKLISGILKTLAAILRLTPLTSWLGDIVYDWANGISKSVNGAMDNLIDTEGFKNALTDAKNTLLSGSSDFGEFTITPVLDLSNVRSGAASINSMMSNINGATANVGLASSVSKSFGRSAASGNNTGVVNNTNTTNNDNVYNTFNITASDPQAVANEIDRRLNQMSLRRKAANG